MDPPSCPALCHGRPARFVLEGVHGIDSTRFQKVANQLDSKGINAVQHENIVFRELLKHVPWPILDQLVDKYGADADCEKVTTKAHLIAMLYAQLSGARGLREIRPD